jgi:DNA-binding MurR/RpiR family transcriptional regulator
MRRRAATPSPFKEVSGAASARDQEHWRERISRAFERMSASNRKVASFLLEHPTEAAFMTGSQLAYRLDLDPATIVRFAQSLGYPGYPELSADVQASVRSIFEVAQEVKQPTGGSASAAWQNGLLGTAALVQNMAGVIVWKDARRFLNVLREAKQIIVVTETGDHILGEWLVHNLRLAGLRALAIDSDPRVCRALVESMHAGDVLVGVAVTVEGRGVADVLRAGVARGARALALAPGSATPAGLASEVTLATSAGDNSGQRLGSVSFAAIVESLRRALVVQAA